MTDASPSNPARSVRAIENRRKLMLEQIIRSGSAQVEDLASRFGISRMTVHRDLDALAERGMVRKQHGGVTLHESSSVESGFAYRSHVAERQKAAIARAAADLIRPGQTVLLDESTTTLFMAPHLASRTPLTVITNGLALIDGLKETHGVALLTLGGGYNPKLNAFFGLVCEAAVSSLWANLLFMSTSTVHGAAAYHQDEDVLKAKRAFMGVADTRVLMVDSSKFGVTALHRMAGLDAFDVVITDSGLPEADRGRLLDAGVRLTVVEY